MPRRESIVESIAAGIDGYGFQWPAAVTSVKCSSA